MLQLFMEVKNLLHVIFVARAMYTERKTLKAHIKVVHEGQKRFKCNVCYNNFTQNNTYLAIWQQFMKESGLIIATFVILALHQTKV